MRRRSSAFSFTIFAWYSTLAAVGTASIEKADVFLAAATHRARRAAASSSASVSGSTTSPRCEMRDHRAEDPAMALVVEHRVVDMLTGAENRVRVHEHRRDHRLLGLRSAGSGAVAEGVTRLRCRGFFERAGHLPMLAASTPDCGAARPDDR